MEYCRLNLVMDFLVFTNMINMFLMLTIKLFVL